MLSLASVWASPVTGVFLAVAAVAIVPARAAREAAAPADRLAALALGAPAVAGGLAMAALFPEGGSDHFVGTAFWPMLLVCLGALALVDPTPAHGDLGRRDLRHRARRRVRDPEPARAERAAPGRRARARAAGAVRAPARAAASRSS